jgi:hypothetical protein
MTTDMRNFEEKDVISLLFYYPARTAGAHAQYNEEQGDGIDNL